MNMNCKNIYEQLNMQQLNRKTNKSCEYQTTMRSTATRAKISIITQYIHPSARTAIDVGSQQGLITVRLSDLGIKTTGYESDIDFFNYSRKFAISNKNNAIFVNRCFDLDVVNEMDNVDVSLFLSSYHQIVKKMALNMLTKF